MFELSETPQLPEYECHKRVRAAKITGVLRDEADDHELILEGGIRVRVDVMWMMKHAAEPGGYYVLYADGYASFSPAQAFEQGYTLVQQPVGSGG